MGDGERAEQLTTPYHIRSQEIVLYKTYSEVNYKAKYGLLVSILY